VNALVVGARDLGVSKRAATRATLRIRPSGQTAYFGVCGSRPAAFQRSAEPALASIFTKPAAGS